METNLEHTNASTRTAYTWKSLSADLTVLNESVPGGKGEDEDGPFHVIIEDRGRDYTYRYTLVRVWNDATGPVSYSIPGFPSGEYFRTPRDLRDEMNAAAFRVARISVVRI